MILMQNHLPWIITRSIVHDFIWSPFAFCCRPLAINFTVKETPVVTSAQLAEESMTVPASTTLTQGNLQICKNDLIVSISDHYF